jgi:hypothetical protein
LNTYWDGVWFLLQTYPSTKYCVSRNEVCSCYGLNV